MSHKGWIAVDLDGTLAHYDGWKGVDHIGDPVPLMATRVRLWLQEGKDVRIFTARVSGRDIRALGPIQHWCQKHFGTVLSVTCEKDMAMIELWDDRCVQVVPNTGQRADGLSL